MLQVVPHVESLFLSLSLLILRVGIGGMMAFGHGWPKLVGFAEKSQSFPDPIGLGSPVALGLAIFAEFFCSIAIVVGFKTRLAAIPVLITMLVAAIIIHAEDPWGTKEMAVLYAVPLLSLILAGSGAFSLDAVMRKRG